MLMLCLAPCFTHSKYILHALAGNRTVEEQEEPCMDELRYNAKKVVIVSQQVREPLHNSLCRQFSTKQPRGTQTFVEVRKPCTVDHLYKHH